MALPGLTKPFGRGIGVVPPNVSNATSVWSSTDIAPQLILAMGGVQFVNPVSAVDYAARGTKAASGRVYLEFILSGTGSSSPMGVGNLAASLMTNVGGDSSTISVGYNPGTGRYTTGGVAYYFGGTGSNRVSPGYTPIVGMAVDSSNLTVWFNIIGSWYGTAANSDPVAGIGGIPILNGPLLPMASANSSSSQILNTGFLPFYYPIPLSYSAWG